MDTSITEDFHCSKGNEKSKAMTEKLLKLLTDSGYNVMDDTFVRYYEDRNIVLLNVSIEYPKIFKPVLESEDNLACEYRELILETVKTFVEDTPEVWVIYIELVYCDGQKSMMTNSRFYISMRSSDYWFEIDLKRMN